MGVTSMSSNTTARPAERTDIQSVIIGGDIGAYALGREFHEAYGMRSVIINSGFIGAIEHSKIFETMVVPKLDGEHILGALESLASTDPDKTWVLVANTDPLIDLLEDILDQLPSNVSCVIPERSAYDAVCDKATFSQLCRDHGLDVPRMDVVHLAGDEPIAPTEIPFPVVAKPAVSAGYYDMLLAGFQKTYFANGQDELDELWEGLRGAGFTGDFLVQELIGGDDTYMDSLTIYMGADGTAHMLGAAQVLLEDHAPTMLGNPVAMITREKRELWEKATKMLASVGYRGFANFDVKRDPNSDRELFLDCNPRIGRNSYYNLAGGVNPMEVLVRDSVDGEAGQGRVVEGHVLYTLVPLSLLRRYVRDENLLAELDGLIAEGSVFDPQRYDADWGMRRRIDVELTERNQIRKFAKYYPKPTDTSF